MTEPQDVNVLRRRGRRRLVGAIALVLLAAIVLPMVFDQEPASGVPPVSVRIPSEDERPFEPKSAPGSAALAPVPNAQEKPAPVAPAQPPAREPEAAAGASAPGVPGAPKAAEKPAVSAEQNVPAKTPEPPPSPAAAQRTPGGEQFVVPVAALAQPAKIKALMVKLKEGHFPHYTEPVATASGTVTRVRVGPYASREAAEEARGRLERLGLKPGQVLAKQ